MESTRAQAEMCLKNNAITPTKQRVAVLAALMSFEEPVSIDALEKKTKKTANYVTLYRILKLFVEKGLVYQTDFRVGKSFYEYQEKNHHHHHIICTTCGFREEVHACDALRDRRRILRTSSFSEITSHALEYFGTCKKCVS